MNESQYVGVNEAPSGADYVAYFAEHKGFTCLQQNPEVILGYLYNNKAYGSAKLLDEQPGNSEYRQHRHPVV